MKGVLNMEEKRYCTVKESLIESCKEVKAIREGKLPKKTWKDLMVEMKKWEKETATGNV